MPSLETIAQPLYFPSGLSARAFFEDRLRDGLTEELPDRAGKSRWRRTIVPCLYPSIFIEQRGRHAGSENKSAGADNHTAYLGFLTIGPSGHSQMNWNSLSQAGYGTKR